MARLARRLRQGLGVTSKFMLWGLVLTLCGSGCVVPPLFSFPPEVAFISNGQFEGTQQTPLGITAPITGTVAYLPGNPNHIKLHISIDIGKLANTGGLIDTGGLVDTGGQPVITIDQWVTSTPTVIKKWQISSTDPTNCQILEWAGKGVNDIRRAMESGHTPPTVLEGIAFFAHPKCTAWMRTQSGGYSLECKLRNFQIIEGTLDILANLNSDNQLVQLQQTSTISGTTDSTTIIMTAQGTTPPVPSDFDLPSICVPGGSRR